MRRIFADTFYFLALLDSREAFHRQAFQYSRDNDVHLVTTEWVLAEFGNAYSDPRDRADFVEMYRVIKVHRRVKIVESETRVFEMGVELFSERADKEWSLVDCISFVVMRSEGLVEALTGDRHFEQAGFLALLNEDGGAEKRRGWSEW